jgi:hypothetical protein
LLLQPDECELGFFVAYRDRLWTVIAILGYRPPYNFFYVCIEDIRGNKEEVPVSELERA